MLLHQKGHYKERANRLIGVVLDPVLAVHYETAFGKYWVPGISQKVSVRCELHLENSQNMAKNEDNPC